MFVKLILAIFALIVMLGTRSYADDPLADSSEFTSQEGEMAEGGLPEGDEEGLSDSDESIQEDEELANEDALSEESLDGMYSDDAEIQ